MIKSAIVYKITDGYELDISEINNKSAQDNYTYSDPSGQQIEKMGWLPNPASEALGGAVVSGSGIHRMLFRVGKRDLPSSVVNYELSKRLEMMKESGEDVDNFSRKQIKEIKELVYEELLPKSFIKVSEIPLYIVPKDGLIYVATTSAKTSDMVISFLREMTGSLKIECFRLNENINLTSWFLESSYPSGELSIGFSADLKDAEGGALKVNKRSLDGELPSYAHDMNVEKLELVISERITFSINSLGFISKISIEENLEEEEGDEIHDIVSEMILNHDIILTIINELESQ